MLLRKMKCIAGRLVAADRRPTALAVPLLPELAALTPQGWRLLMVADVSRALTILGQKQIPVVFCDRDIPNVSWKEAVRTLAAAPSKPCVVLLSSSMSPELWEQITEFGSYDVLRKPATAEDLLRVLQAGLCQWRSRRRLQTMCGMPLHR
jgi:CheY-like chemotaxis protein